MMVNQKDLVAHLQGMQSIAIAIVGLDESESVLSRVFLKATQKPPRHSKNIKAWLATMIKNEAIDCARSSSRRIARERRLPATDLPSTPPELLEKAETRALIQSALMSLPEPQRHILILRYYEDCSPREIGLKFGISHSAVRTRISRALGVLREKLRKKSGDNNLNACLVMLGVPQRLLGSSTIAVVLPITLTLLILAVLITKWAVLNFSGDVDGENLASSTALNTSSSFDAQLFTSTMATSFSRADLQAQLSLQLFDENENCISKAKVTLFHDGLTYSGNELNDVAGVYSFQNELQDLSSKSVALIAAPGRVPVLQQLDWATHPRQFIHLPNENLLSGKVNFMSRIRNRPLFLSLGLNSIRQQPGSEFYSLRSSLTAMQMKLVDSQFDACSLRVTSDGYFRFWGLPTNWSGELRLTSGIHRLSGANMRLGIQRLDFLGPTVGIMLNIDEFPSVSGIIRPASDARRVSRFLAVGNEHNQVMISDWFLDKETGKFQLYFNETPADVSYIKAVTEDEGILLEVNNYLRGLDFGDVFIVEQLDANEHSEFVPTSQATKINPGGEISKTISGVVLDAEGMGASKAMLVIKNAAGEWRTSSFTLAYGDFSANITSSDQEICARIAEGAHSRSMSLADKINGDSFTLQLENGGQRKVNIDLPPLESYVVRAYRVPDGLPLRSYLEVIDDITYVSFYCSDKDTVRIVIQNDGVLWERKWSAQMGVE